MATAVYWWHIRVQQQPVEGRDGRWIVLLTLTADSHSKHLSEKRKGYEIRNGRKIFLNWQSGGRIVHQQQGSASLYLLALKKNKYNSNLLQTLSEVPGEVWYSVFTSHSTVSVWHVFTHAVMSPWVRQRWSRPEISQSWLIRLADCVRWQGDVLLVTRPHQTIRHTTAPTAPTTNHNNTTSPTTTSNTERETYYLYFLQ